MFKDEKEHPCLFMKKRRFYYRDPGSSESLYCVSKDCNEALQIKPGSFAECRFETDNQRAAICKFYKAFIFHEVNCMEFLDRIGILMAEQDFILNSKDYKSGYRAACSRIRDYLVTRISEQSPEADHASE